MSPSALGHARRRGITSIRGAHYELPKSKTNAALNEQVEQRPEVEIRESARTDCGHADRVDDDVKLASNNLDTLMRRMSLTSTREIDSLIGELKVCV